MNDNFSWNFEHRVLDDAPLGFRRAVTTVVDINDDGFLELIIAGEPPQPEEVQPGVSRVGGREIGALVWYEPPLYIRHVINYGHFALGALAIDLTGNGHRDVIASLCNPFRLFWYERPQDPLLPWRPFPIDLEPEGLIHDMALGDINGDGRLELVCNAMPFDSEDYALHWYEIPQNPYGSWTRYDVHRGVLSEGLALADINNNGRLDVIAGPDWYENPGNLSGEWPRHVFASEFRERCRLHAVDMDRDGKMDIVIAEAEYVDSKVSWFRNPGDGSDQWEEIAIARDMYFAHTLSVTDMDGDGDYDVLAGEMAQGGFGAPPNKEPRIVAYENLDDKGGAWAAHVVAEGMGTHEGVAADLDGDGLVEIVAKPWHEPVIHLWKPQVEQPALVKASHSFIDQEKTHPCVDILVGDVTGNGLDDVVCGEWWYRNGDWNRFEIPHIKQAVLLHDLDGDGRMEIIGTTGPDLLTPNLVWVKAEDPTSDQWEVHEIGTMRGDWIHGATIAPVAPDWRDALLTSSHHREPQQFFEVPEDPRQSPWPRHTLAQLNYSEQMQVADIDNDGKPEIIAGRTILKRDTAINWIAHPISQDYYWICRVQVMDVNHNGRLDIVVCEERLDFEQDYRSLIGRLTWFEAPEDPIYGEWTEHVIAKLKSPHSMDVADVDGDGELEIIVAEHDPFNVDNPVCKLSIFKATNPEGTHWQEQIMETRFEHHVGTKVIRLDESGRLGIVSQGWKQAKYVHLWALEPADG